MKKRSHLDPTKSVMLTSQQIYAIEISATRISSRVKTSNYRIHTNVALCVVDLYKLKINGFCALVVELYYVLDFSLKIVAARSGFLN